MNTKYKNENQTIIIGKKDKIMLPTDGESENKVRLKIPANLDLISKVEEDSAGILFRKASCIIKMYEILSLIRGNKKKHDQDDEKKTSNHPLGFVPVNSKTLTRLIGKDYANYIKILEHFKIIEVSRIAVQGVESFGYKISECYLIDEWVLITTYDKHHASRRRRHNTNAK